VVIVCAPCSDQVAGLAYRWEQVFIEALSSHSAIKAFNKTVLHGLSSSNRASEVFSKHLLQGSHIQHLLCQHLLQLRVLGLKRLQPPRIGKRSCAKHTLPTSRTAVRPTSRVVPNVLTTDKPVEYKSKHQLLATESKEKRDSRPTFSECNAHQRLFGIIAHKIAVVLFDHGNASA